MMGRGPSRGVHHMGTIVQLAPSTAGSQNVIAALSGIGL